MVRLEAAYGPLPTDAGEQGRQFYKIFSAHGNTVGVLDAHRSYLAARDMGMINLILFILLPGFAWWTTGDGIRTSVYAGALLLAYLLTGDCRAGLRGASSRKRFGRCICRSQLERFPIG